MRHSRTGRDAASFPGPPYTQEVELAWLDGAGVITAVNSAWYRFCAENDGDPTACGPGVSYLEVCDADPRAAPVAAAIRAQLGGSQVHPVVFTVPCDGPRSAQWYDVHISPRLGETGEVQGVVIALVPVTPPLSDLARDLPITDLVEGVPDGALLIDDEGDIRYVNGQLLALTGHERSALLGAPVETLVGDELRSRHRGWRAAYQQTPRSRSMGTGATLSLRRADGTLVPVEISLAPVPVGDLVMTFASVRDVSEIRAQDRARSRLIDMLDLDPDAVYVIDADTARIEYASSGASTLLGYTRDELMAMTFWEVSPRADEALRRRRLREHELLGPGHVHLGEVVRRAKDGSEIPCDSRGQLVREPDGRRMFTVVDRDARPRLAAEAERERQLRLSRLVAEITQLVLSDVPTHEVFARVVSGSAALVDAEDASIVVDPGTGEFLVLAATGAAAEATLRQRVVFDRDILLPWMYQESPMFLPDGPPGVTRAGVPPQGPGVVAPFRAADERRGLLTAFRAPGRDAFSAAEGQVLADLAGQVGLVIELGRARAADQRLKIVEERQRIARDLHDMVIQDLIGIGMQLAGRGGPAEARAADLDLVGQLDDTIRRLRLVVFDARSTALQGSVHDEITRTVREAARTLDHRPVLSVDAGVDTLPDDVVPHLLSVLREGLSNVARHAGARATEVRVTVTAESIEVLIQDDGCGLPDGLLHGTGTASLRERAEMMSGSLSLADRPEGGARLSWTAPLGPRTGA